MPAPFEFPKRDPGVNPSALHHGCADSAHHIGLFIADSTTEHEDPKEFANIYARYVADFRPTPGIETEFVRQLASATQRLRRFDRMETALLYSQAVAHTRHEASVLMSEAYIRTSEILEKIGRGRAAAERSFNRVYKELEARKAARLSKRPAPTHLEIEVDTRHRPLDEPSTRMRWVPDGVTDEAEPPAVNVDVANEPPPSPPAAPQKRQPKAPPSPGRRA